MLAWVLSSSAAAQTPQVRDSQVEVSVGGSGSGETEVVEESVPLHEARVARLLHPVRPQLLLDTHQATSRSMAGPRASPVHRDVVNDLHVHWRMVSEGYADPWTEQELRDEALELAVSGSWFGLSSAMMDRLVRHPQLSVLVAAADTAARPELEIQDGKARLGAGQPRIIHPGRTAWPSLEE
ncbi:MAG: hypothetical protein QGG40_05945, partial [Myxococcota bacterium]|nr:hypothetical protein [Myxococcota bacterium]